MVLGRLAPSPTGGQHVGNARTYLIAWLSARSQGGEVVLRMEDLDVPRVKPGAVEQALGDLTWLGLDWDRGPIFQTQRHGLYRQALKVLQESEMVYPCTCSRADVERAASAPHAENEPPLYPGTCAGRSVAEADKLGNRPFSWRVRFGTDRLPFDDLFRGPIDLAPRDLGGDFVVWKSDGTPAYQLAVVVDDADQGVTEVIRGDDLIPSTPRQLLLYRALGLNPPRFGHVPLVIDAEGRRLAKRHEGLRLASLREAGWKPEKLLGWLAWSCGWVMKNEPVSLRELIGSFDLKKIPRTPYVLPGDVM